LLIGLVVALVAAMALDTTVVRIDPDAEPAAGTFSPAASGAAELPRIRAAVETRRQVLEGLGSDSLTGREISITGVFKLVNPKSWLVTPVDVKLL